MNIFNYGMHFATIVSNASHSNEWFANCLANPLKIVLNENTATTGGRKVINMKISHTFILFLKRFRLDIEICIWRRKRRTNQCVWNRKYLLLILCFKHLRIGMSSANIQCVNKCYCNFLLDELSHLSIITL